MRFINYSLEEIIVEKMFTDKNHRE